MSKIRIKNYTDEIDFCGLSTFMGIVLGFYMFLIGAILNYLPGIVGVFVYVIIAAIISIVIIAPCLKKHDEMECRIKFPAGIATGFILSIYVSYYMLNTLGWI